nr:SprB repeat-containing protein [Clostridia bacterium]
MKRKSALFMAILMCLTLTPLGVSASDGYESPTASLFASLMDAIETLVDSLDPAIKGNTSTPDVELITPLKIIAQPLDTNVFAGETAYVSIKVSGGTAPVEFRWQFAYGKNWIDVPKNVSNVKITSIGDTSTLAINNDTEIKNSVRCIVTDSMGRSAVSDDALISFYKKPAAGEYAPLTIKTQPKDASGILGNSDATLTTEVTGGKAPITYQWLFYDTTGKVWNDVSGANSNTLTVNSEKAYGDYKCLITDAEGNYVITDTATVSKFEKIELIKTFKITAQPKDTSLNAENTASFSITVSGGKAPYKFKWENKHMGDDVWSTLHTSTDILFTSSITVAADMKYPLALIRCTVTDALGTTITSNEASLLMMLRITGKIGEHQLTAPTELKNYTVSAGGGLAPYTYTWYQRSNDTADPVKIYEQTLSSGTCSVPFTFKNLDDGRVIRLKCVVTDALGNSVEDEGRVYYKAPLEITKQPESAALTSKYRTGSFTVEVSGGTAPYKYEWQIAANRQATRFTTIETNKSTNLTHDMFEFDFDVITGTYYVRVVITDANGNQAISDLAKVTVLGF